MKNHTHTKHKTLSAATVAAFSVLILHCTAGCSNGALSEARATTEVQFTFEPAAGTVVWWSADNAPLEKELTASEAGSGTVTLTLKQGSVTPVMLYREDILEPAGCIWPVSAIIDDGGGFPARMLWRLLNETDPESGTPEAIRAFCERFNWKRFCDVVATIENPWNIDQQMVLNAIADGSFTQKCLK